MVIYQNDTLYGRPLEIVGNIAYVFNSGIDTVKTTPPGQPPRASEGLYIFDISDLTNPTLLGSYSSSDLAHVRILSMLVEEDTAYLWDDGDLLRVDVTDPSNPTLIHMYVVPDGPFETTLFDFVEIVISGDYVFPTGKEFQILELDEPPLPADLEIQGDSYEMEIMGEYALVANGFGGLQIFKVNSATDFTPVGTFPVRPSEPGTAAFTTSVTARGNLAYVTDRIGLQIIDITDPASPSLVGSLETPGLADDVDIQGDYAYVADGLAGMHVVDIGDPAAPTIVTNYPAEVWVNALTISDNTLFLSVSEWLDMEGWGVDLRARLEIVDISVPLNPQLLGSYQEWDTPFPDLGQYIDPLWYYLPPIRRNISQSGSFVFLVDGMVSLNGTLKLQVIDISDLTNPTLVSVSPFSCSPPVGNGRKDDVDQLSYGAISVAGNYAYLTSDNKLCVINVTDPSSQEFVRGFWINSSVIRDITVAGNTVYVSGDKTHAFTLCE
jgi:hypothetical protein